MSWPPNTDDFPHPSYGDGSMEPDTEYTAEELLAEDDDDEELDETPEDVIAILGFDPFPP
jgi:hypothetical protein